MELYLILSPLIIGALLITTLKYRAAYLNATAPYEVTDEDIESIELSHSKLQLLDYHYGLNPGLSD